jgi:hypothetical protein
MFYEEGTKFTIGNSSPTRHNKRVLLDAVMLEIETDELGLMT